MGKNNLGIKVRCGDYIKTNIDNILYGTGNVSMESKYGSRVLGNTFTAYFESRTNPLKIKRVRLRKIFGLRIFSKPKDIIVPKEAVDYVSVPEEK